MLFKNANPSGPKPTLVSIGGAKVGIIGLDEAFEAVRKKSFADDAALGDALIALVKEKNYIPASALDEYRKGLVRAYKVRYGLPVDLTDDPGGMLEIKVVGPGCPQCRKMYEDVLAVLQELNIQADVEKIEDLAAIASTGVLLTPSLIINGQVRAAGRVPSKKQLAQWIETAGKQNK
ncbi:MAG: thioredoxin family protein [Thermoanaerobacterales bacterium]|nr:thioredoxin family protein [Bacillota bacterium]MDI6908066.1 thioredoxin family protein [Thermoanaerobacterales bacterium]